MTSLELNRGNGQEIRTRQYLLVQPCVHTEHVVDHDWMDQEDVAISTTSEASPADYSHEPSSLPHS